MRMCVITFVFIILDFITGLLYALHSKTYTSTVMRQGLWHKLGSLLALVFGYAVDYAQDIMGLTYEIPIFEVICIYIFIMECGSIIENIGSINPNVIPTSVRKYFKKLQQNIETDGKEEE